jgi:peptidoglycan/xylan/chitin deacetylase (PgdA/CDA1 family)
VPPGKDVALNGQGDIVTITGRPVTGERSIALDPNGYIIDERFQTIPAPYELTEYGPTGKQIAITFDDGPDPVWTPKILDVLKARKAPATFFVIGDQAEKYSSIVERIYREGHEIGNHTWTHPDVSAVWRPYMIAELNLTQRFLAGQLGIRRCCSVRRIRLTRSPILPTR